ncbi:MAG: hypothetical protein QOH31_2229 [Verrucomicrobiota bacterium]
MWKEEKEGTRINQKRFDQINAAAPRTMAVGCPFCMTMLGDGIKAKQLEEKVQTLDVMEIVDKATRSGDAEA